MCSMPHLLFCKGNHSSWCDVMWNKYSISPCWWCCLSQAIALHKETATSGLSYNGQIYLWIPVEDPFPNTITLGIRASAYYLEGVGHIQSIAVYVYFNFRPLAFHTKWMTKCTIQSSLHWDVEMISPSSCLSKPPKIKVKCCCCC